MGNGFSTELDIVSECGKCGSGRIFIAKKDLMMLEALRKEINDEWLLWIIGKLEGYTFVVEGFETPKQEVSGASVDIGKAIKDEPIPEGCIGTVHSHNTMSAFWSGTDKEFLLNNFPINIVMGNDGYRASARIELPCGSLFLDDNVKLLHEATDISPLYDDFLKEIKEKSEKKSYTNYYGRGAATTEWWEEDYKRGSSNGRAFGNYKQNTIKFSGKDEIKDTTKEDLIWIPDYYKVLNIDFMSWQKMTIIEKIDMIDIYETYYNN